MAKRYCPLKTAMMLFNNDSEKLVDFTLNCRSLYFRLKELFNNDFTFERMSNTIAELTRVNEILRTSYQNWEEDNYNITYNHIQFLGVNEDFTVFHFGRYKDRKYYIDFSVRDEGNAHYVVDREYEANSNDAFSMAYDLRGLYEMIKKQFVDYVEKQNADSLEKYLTEHESKEECKCETECAEDCTCSCHDSSEEENKE